MVRLIVKRDGRICNLIFIHSSGNAMQSAVSKLLYQSIPWQAGANDGRRLLNVLGTIKLLFNYDQPNRGLTAKASYVKPS